MFVKYSPKIPHIKIIPLMPSKASEGYTFDNDSVILRPGTNELTEKEWDAIQPHIKDQLGKEIVPFTVPVDTKGGKKKAKTLRDVPVATARKIIQACEDPNTLKKWFNQELPDELILVLSKRMRKLKVEPDDITDDIDKLTDSDITQEDGEDVGGDDGDPGSETGTDADTDTEETDTDSGEDAGGEGNTGEDDEEVPDFDGSKNESKKRWLFQRGGKK